MSTTTSSGRNSWHPRPLKLPRFRLDFKNTNIYPELIFFHFIFTTGFPAARSFNHSYLRRLAPSLELSSQMDSTADYLSSCCLSQYIEDPSNIRAKWARVIANSLSCSHKIGGLPAGVHQFLCVEISTAFLSMNLKIDQSKSWRLGDNQKSDGGKVFVKMTSHCLLLIFELFVWATSWPSCIA